MIVYLHPSQSPRTPPWLEGFQPPDSVPVELCRRETEYGHLIGVGDPLIFDSPPLRDYCEIADGWRVARVGDLDPLHLLRAQRWARTVRVESIDGLRWQAPVILDADGEEAYLVSYGGPDFLPLRTPVQQRCHDVAVAARAAIEAKRELDMAPACRWAAVLLSATHHVSPEVLAVLGLLDDRLITETLAAATGLPLRVEKGAPA